jgi:hypothetical protein
VRRYYYDSHDRLRAHLAAFLAAYNFAKRLKTLKGLTPFEHIELLPVSRTPGLGVLAELEVEHGTAADVQPGVQA